VSACIVCRYRFSPGDGRFRRQSRGQQNKQQNSDRHSHWLPVTQPAGLPDYIRRPVADRLGINTPLVLRIRIEQRVGADEIHLPGNPFGQPVHPAQCPGSEELLLTTCRFQVVPDVGSGLAEGEGRQVIANRDPLGELTQFPTSR
jgi:hypothetical protein